MLIKNIMTTYPTTWINNKFYDKRGGNRAQKTNHLYNNLISFV